MSRKIVITTTSKKMLADLYTPVGIYLRLRDRFRDTILLESTDYHVSENSFSFIGIQAIAGIEVKNNREIEYKLPNEEEKKVALDGTTSVVEQLSRFIQTFEVNKVDEKPVAAAQGVFGYTGYDAIQFFDTISLQEKENSAEIPLMRYRLYQYVIAINHFKNELYICENSVRGNESNVDLIETIIRSKDVPTYPFEINGPETCNTTDEEYLEMVRKGIHSCARGDVFQIVLSRRYQRPFLGDEFNVYRSLRNINPSPYLFYFDYGDYRLFGSSPESQLIVKDGQAVVHPIAGTFRRTNNAKKDAELAEQLLLDKKENAEHVMLVDLARNDLSKACSDVEVSKFCEVQYFSHVIHMVSEVTGKTNADTEAFHQLANTFPAGTLSGAPKFKAMELIDAYENTARGYYGGCIGFIGFNGGVNHAILIRTFLSKSNTLTWQAGAGITISSVPENELDEVKNKLNALTAALTAATKI